MLLTNTICIYGSITNESYEKFTLELEALVRQTAEGDRLTFSFNSPGGDTNVGMGMFDLIKNSHRRTKALVAGRAESVAAMLVQACDHRVMTRHSSMLIHSSTVSVKATVENARIAIERSAAMDTYAHEIFAERTGKAVDEIRRLAERDAMFDAQAAKQYGLVDEII